MIYSCPLCGKSFSAARAGVFRCPGCGGEVKVSRAEGGGNAWDAEPGRDWAGAFISCVRDSIARPVDFFTQVARGRGCLRPWTFALIISAMVFVIAAAYQFGFQALASSVDLGSFFDPAEAAAAIAFLPLSAGALVAFAVVGVPVGTTLALLIQAGVIHLCLMMLGAAKRGFDATFRVVCYSTSAQLFQIVPLIGGPIAWAWQTALAIIGVKVSHETTYGRSSVAVFLPLIFCCGFIALIGVAVMGFVFAALIAKA